MQLHNISAVEEPESMAGGEFVTRDGERFYLIRDFDRMPPFFMSVISSGDLWLFISSTGALTAGRVSADQALFPYVTVDKIHDAALHTGSRTLFRLEGPAGYRFWEPFNREHDDRYALRRNLYKNVLGSCILFEEINEDLELRFSYDWRMSEEHGFVRRAGLENLSTQGRHVEVLDGLQNLMAAGTPRSGQDLTSNLVDAYKWSELDPTTGLAMYGLYSGISDRAEPCESLRANTVYALGAGNSSRLLSSEQLDEFRRGAQPRNETLRRGVRGAYFVHMHRVLAANEEAVWQLIADVEKSQSDITRQLAAMESPDTVAAALERSLLDAGDMLSSIMGRADAFQSTGEEPVSAHHYANVLFNVLRGGIFNNGYRISSAALAPSIRHFNSATARAHQEFLESLPDTIELNELLRLASKQEDPQLRRLCYEYLPITFGRRHGDPSRPWNRFNIDLKDEHGNPRLSYEGNWRDIFQNWEALCFSYPEYAESIIAKFLNASTRDGYNPYRITDRGIDWEVEDPDDPWSYIGYWGDHQIIYLQKLLELSGQFHPEQLSVLLDERLFAFANVPYRIRTFSEVRLDPKSTVVYDESLAEEIDRRVAAMGADGKLVLAAGGDVLLVTLAEKLLIPLLTKLSNLVPGGGIWMNTQRPEWNDANNALVGNGVSMVTLYYMHRYIAGLLELLAEGPEYLSLSAAVVEWMESIYEVLQSEEADRAPADPAARFRVVRRLVEAADAYRARIYTESPDSESADCSRETVLALLRCSLQRVNETVVRGERDDGLYHAYNLMHIEGEQALCEHLYLMLEGQVAVLSSGALPADRVPQILDALFRSDCYRADIDTFMLYPDRALPRLLERNRIPDGAMPEEVVSAMQARGDRRLFETDAGGVMRFNADFRNAGDLLDMLDTLRDDYDSSLIDRVTGSLMDLYERVFQHRAFTGRSGGMFAFEGLGSVYWHMVSKLLLAVQENYFAALDSGAGDKLLKALGDAYYRVRSGIGFNRTPQEYGAFPTDPYSHTPAHAGAQQPGMTGQVKEEVLTRFGELGLRVAGGIVHFAPTLLRLREFRDDPGELRYLDLESEWQTLSLRPGSLAFTWCQVPVIYELTHDDRELTLTLDDGREERSNSLALSRENTASIAKREGRLRSITVRLPRSSLLGD